MIRVVTSAEAAERDALAIAAGTPSRALMQRAGAAAAGEIALRYRDRLSSGVLVLAGPGNNGGDGYVIARALRASGVRVSVIETGESKTDDARAERILSRMVRDPDAVQGGEGILVDALLGTGASGAPRGPVAELIRECNTRRDRGAVVVAVDLPSGLDATSGEIADPCVTADLTLTFGSIKRGHLVARGTCGAIVALDIGLGQTSPDEKSGRLVDDHWAAERLPRWVADAHKGTRGKLAIVGGASGMSGAAVLAARAAARSGIGMVKLVVSRESLPIVQETEPYALAATWPEDAAAVERDIVSWADAVVIGPGLGRSDESRAVLERVLQSWTGITLLDADAITLFEGAADRLRDLLGSRPCLLTPHPVELSRIAGVSPETVLANRFEIGAEVARRLRATVLLKGVPTVVSVHSGETMISGAGTPALATAGSGDVLSGIAGTLLAQIGDPMSAGALAAFVHGRAAERVPSVNGARGITLEDIVGELRNVWDFDTTPTRYPVLAELPAITR